MEGFRLPAPFDAARCLVSPLDRARATAMCVKALTPHVVEPRLIEMDWGAFSGQSVEALRASLGDAFLANEARGLDFKPAGGETPREVQVRLGHLAREIAPIDAPHIAVTHKGVIRAALAMGTDWDMKGRAPVRLQWQALHVFRALHDGSFMLQEANVPLLPVGAR